MVVRLQARALGVTAPGYRWAVTLVVPTGKPRVTHFDEIPNEPHFDADGQDNYIPQGR
jgi:hypothetical protein